MAPARQCYTVSANALATTIATRRHDLGTADVGGAVASDRHDDRDRAADRAASR